MTHATPLDLSRVVRSFGKPTDFVRPGPTTYTNGVATEAGSSTFSLIAVIQPLSGKEVEAFAGGRRTEDFVRVDVLLPGLKVDDSDDAGQLRAGDRVTYRRKLYEAWSFGDWAETANFQSCTFQKVEDA